MKQVAAVFVAALLLAGAAQATTGASGGEKEAESKQAGYWRIWVDEYSAGGFIISVYINGGLYFTDADTQAVYYDVWLDEGDEIEAYLTSSSGDYDLRLDDPYGTEVDSSSNAPANEPDYVYGYAGYSGSSSSSRICGAAPARAGLLLFAPLAAVLLAARRRVAAARA